MSDLTTRLRRDVLGRLRIDNASGDFHTILDAADAIDALEAEIGPLRERVGVRFDATTYKGDIDNW